MSCSASFRLHGIQMIGFAKSDTLPIRSMTVKHERIGLDMMPYDVLKSKSDRKGLRATLPNSSRPSQDSLEDQDEIFKALDATDITYSPGLLKKCHAMPLTQEAAPRATHRGRSIILTGIPSSSSLRWDEDALLRRDECWFCLQDERRSREKKQGTASSDVIKWRTIPFQTASGRKRDDDGDGDDLDDPMPPGKTRRKEKDIPLLYEGGTILRYSGQSLTNITLPLLDSQEANASAEFYDESIALHEDMDMTDTESSVPPDNVLSSGTPSSPQESQVTPPPALPPALPGHFTPLAHLARQFPPTLTQTPPTVSLIVGILAVYPRRRVATKFGREMDVVEILVGDETVHDTAEGLRVSFWLEPTDSLQTVQEGRITRSQSQRCAVRGRGPLTSLADTLANLHRGDVVYLRPVALRVYRDRIYAQSVRNGMTKVDLLYRWLYLPTSNYSENPDSHGATSRDAQKDRGLEPGRYTAELLSKAAHQVRERGEDLHPQVLKVIRVREWVLRRVGGEGGVATGDDRDGKGGLGVEHVADTSGVLGHRKLQRMKMVALPPDTQHDE